MFQRNKLSLRKFIIYLHLKVTPWGIPHSIAKEAFVYSVTLRSPNKAAVKPLVVDIVADVLTR
jgi:hypothetical protein